MKISTYKLFYFLSNIKLFKRLGLRMNFWAEVQWACELFTISATPEI